MKAEKTVAILLDGKKKQFKANLHCHSTLSDGRLSPEALKDAYKSRGYDILAITDHCRPYDHSDLSEKDFLLLTGYEAYIRTTRGRVDAFAPEIHMNLIAKEPHNLRYICYNQGYCKYVPIEEHAGLLRVGSERPREYTTEYINEFIKIAVDNGYLVTYNHPFWSMESEERILSYKGYFSVELYNTSSSVINHLENGEMLYDTLLRHGIRVGCHGGDDNHNTVPFDSPDNDSFGGHTVILSDELEYGKIIQALEEGACYASTGPRIYEISLKDGGAGRFVHVECSAARSVYLFFGSKGVKHVSALPGEALTSADFPLPRGARFIRISVCDEAGYTAVSRGYFPDEWEK